LAVAAALRHFDIQARVAPLQIILNHQISVVGYFGFQAVRTTGRINPSLFSIKVQRRVLANQQIQNIRLYWRAY